MHGHYQDLADELIFTEQVTPGKWFGLPCLKANGRIFCALWQDEKMIFKLRPPEHGEALALEGAALFDPGADGHPMREWVQVPQVHAAQWRDFAHAALAYIRNLAPKAPPPPPRRPDPRSV